ncbi:MAG TPA: NAD(P)H-binding protein [Tenuifilaceae bacterium]|nr:NAD(P)H-binding protein [Tenuifilaceae bacterium]HPE17155.1 NAD(P)H-binding protein [Tenuifilaceae bacterium]HPJ45883.1 NAD(P)H-binding protein [Tenuifilaceae bacterium]HPQ34086.1 NAD(P)H-binding protein [Tenuifilaceae bacterium]HRX68743.1 NAD(P)H-binding protein [Tenuifilaceae bacterium]
MDNVVIIGATGLVGRNLVDILSKFKPVKSVFCISRIAPDPMPLGVIHIPFNSEKYSIPANIDAAFCALGTTMKKAGSKETFLEVDLKMVTTFAKKAKEAGINRFAVVSSIGANPKSRNFYLRTKGLMEEEVKKIGFSRLVIVRPSLLLGKRNEKRLGEDFGKLLYSIFRFFFLGPLTKYRGIQANMVANAMVNLAKYDSGTVVVESNSLKEYAS